MNRPETAEDCIICNTEARNRLPDAARQITEELLADTHANCVPGSPCWNCYGIGYTVALDQLGSDYYQAELKRRIYKALSEAR